MDEPKTTQLTESTVEPPPKSEGRRMLEQAFARGSGQLSDASSVAPERTEHSVMEGLPPAKAERVAAMRRELADLQRQLIEAQQRIATELQGRAEDAERFEALEGRLQAQEAKAQQDATCTAEGVTEVASLRSQLATVTATADELRRDVASRDNQITDARRVTDQDQARSSLLNEARTLLATRDGELEVRTAERDKAHQTSSRLERELEDQRKQHGEVTSHLEQQRASVNDAVALIATRDAELAAITSERDALKGEVASARAKMREVADQVGRFGRDLMDGTGSAETASSSGTIPAVTARSAAKPPPVPHRGAAHTEPSQVETILEVSEQPRSRSRIGLVLISGVLLGCVATVAVVKWSSSSSTNTDDRQEVGASPSAALVSDRASERTSPAVTRGQTIAVTGSASSAQPAPSSRTEMNDRPSDQNGPPAPAVTTDGVIVVPQEAAEHRVFVDGRVVPIKNSRAVVPCGSREIRIGSHGTARTLDVACGGETAVPADPSER